MRDIRRSKRFVGIMLGLILLSFLNLTQESVSGYPEYADKDSVQCESETYLMQAGQSTVRVDRLSAAKSSVDDVITRERNATKVTTIRFIAVVYSLFFALQVVYRSVIRCYGSHMIALWENITYIHEIDGKKENAILYTLQGSMVLQEAFSWKKIEQVTG